MDIEELISSIRQLLDRASEHELLDVLRCPKSLRKADVQDLRIAINLKTILEGDAQLLERLAQ